MAERQIYTIPSDIPFLESLAQGLLLRTHHDFARTLVLLPTRRACRSLRDTFLSLNDGKPILLPRMQPLGDVDQDELDLHLAGLYGVKDLPDIAPAMPSLKRLMLLSRLVSTYDPSLSHEQSLKLSSSLATLIDQAHTENLDFSRLVDLVPAGDLADHWQLTLKFLEIITEHWPAILEREGELDAADRRNRLMKALGSAWREKPPPFPLIAAGSTGSIPATSDLLDVISASPQGVVILPGLDQDLDQLSWDNFGATHPQATMRSLLSRLETDRKKIKIWPTVVQRSSPRILLAREIMRPADTINSWNCLTEDQEIIASLKASLENLELIETKTLSDEASTIAIIMREALEIEGRTAALITPDRELARRVSSALKKWNIIVDDSAGSTLPALASGLFLESILTCVCDNFSLISLLNLLKNPLCKTFADTELLRKFELLLCRGPRPQLGLETLRTRTQALIPPDPEILNLVEFLEAAFSPLYPLQKGQHSIKNYTISLATVAEFLSGNHNKPWQGEDGEAASLLLINLQDQAYAISDLGLRAFRDTLNYLMQTVIVHPAKETHPRLVILGQLEARMIQKDVMILGGLNEGSWPAEIPHDPWMSRPMRIQFGLPRPEQSIGLSAHDFSQAICSPRVILTRSLKIDGTPTVPSRWLQRFNTLLKATDISNRSNVAYTEWARSLQHAKTLAIPESRPAPCPPVEARPIQLSATSIESWVKNPYHIYVTKILHLHPLDLLDQDSTASERGSFVHHILEKFLRSLGDGPLPATAYQQLLDLGKAESLTQPVDSAQWLIWWPRFERLAAWFVANENSWRARATPWLLEESGKYTFATARGKFTLTAKADRIDRLRSGGAAIIDYKTGEPPTQKDVQSGKSCQLPLEGLILRHGGYAQAEEAKILAYWKISGGNEPGKSKEHILSSIAEENLITNAEQGLKNLVAAYDQFDTPYISHPPSGARIYEEEKAIAHLARVAEWGNIESEESGGEE